MELKLTTVNGQASGKSVSVSDETFGREFNEGLIHQVVSAYLSGGRAGTKGQKNRAAVSGGGAKPFKQKGTGRARAGTIRSPLWRGGGKTFAATNQDHTQKVNKKMYRAAMSSILSELIRQDRLIIVDGLALEAPKTRELKAKLKAMGLENVLIVTEQIDDNLYLSARNLFEVNVRSAHNVDPVSLIGSDKVLMTAGAVGVIGGILA